MKYKKYLIYLMFALIVIFLILSFIGVYSKYLIDTNKVNENESYTEIGESDKEQIVPTDITDSLVEDSGEYLFTNFKNKIYYFNQQDYDKEMYGTFGTIKGYGCGPTAMAMVLSSFRNERISPVETTNWACSRGYCTSEGTNNNFFSSIAKEYGLVVDGKKKKKSEDNRNTVYESLSTGETLVIISVGVGDFFKGGHYMLLAGFNGDNIVVADPNSRDKTKAYTYEYLMSESTNPQNFYIISENKDGD